ncbi:FAD-binding protein [Flammeovirga sp. SubArs3]|uniref:FAD-binding oxidoreductase n=1 Tax=Flammeovirga sp. SubArs3 TaxID=2995316 RepID=UPI00248CEAC2|nr:FAD-binding protein [Flammeovirga sp. SubArs3]
MKTIFSFFKKLITGIFSLFKKSIHDIHTKKWLYIPTYIILGYALFVVFLIVISGDVDFNQKLENKRVNDITQINPIQVGSVVQPHTNEEISQAILTTTGPISIGGGRYSMGGQIGFQNSLHFDMRQFNKVLRLDKEKKQVTVQTGITWRDLQKIIDKENLSIKIMQTYANFTVGGSISVNCHGRYIGHGPIISSVKEIKVISTSGEEILANREQNQEVFNAAIGGYGGIGVIVEATLQLVDNVKVERKTNLIDVTDYNAFFEKEIKNDTTVIFQNGDLYPPNFDVVNNVCWKVSNKELTDTTRVTPEGINYWLEPKLVEVASWGNWGKWARKTFFDPYFYRNEKVVWRNKEASYDVAEIEPKSREKNTYVLQEYFIPVNNLTSFIPKMKAVYEKYNVNVLNVSLRHAYPDKESYLSWADEEVFALVIYYKQGTDELSKQNVKAWTVEMTDAIISENGKWYLPYQPHASYEQFTKAFQHSDQYFAVKHRLDSLNRFNNKLLDKYNPYLLSQIESKREDIKGYYREEEQTVLTVPEWYLVFNPKEYADYLSAHKNPSDFPYYKSIDEYWKLYDRSQVLVEEAYSENEEYNTMLQVIGVSITMEYAVKMLYENSIGRAFSWLDNGNTSDKENTIVAAHKAYSDFIYHTAWYEFEFMPWISKVWSASNANDANWFRKWERTIFFTLEFTFKAGYAQLIELGAKANYEEPIEQIYLLVSSDQDIKQNKDIKVLYTQDDKKLLSITRWGAFTKSILEISGEDISIQDIGGNDEIVVSVLAEKTKEIPYSNMKLLYESQVVTDESIKRLVCLLPVKDLIPFINVAQDNAMEVEHIFDY